MASYSVKQENFKRKLSNYLRYKYIKSRTWILEFLGEDSSDMCVGLSLLHRLWLYFNEIHDCEFLTENKVNFNRFKIKLLISLTYLHRVCRLIPSKRINSIYHLLRRFPSEVFRIKDFDDILDLIHYYSNN